MPPARGFRDVLPDDARRVAALEALARRTLELYGYREVRLPTVELKELFIKSTGETSDIVEKEMFEWEDAGGRRLALRPEATPGLARLYVDHHLDQEARVQRLFTLGSMFRAERPQAGRYREFVQVDAECIGSSDPVTDVELIELLSRFAQGSGVQDFTVRLNTLGDEACRPAYRDRLKAFLDSRAGDLCVPCRARIGRNPLRALDCKRDGPRLKPDAPRLEPCPPCLEHFERVREGLRLAGMEDRVVLDPHLVRGLDYYTRTVFEFTSKILGAQDAFAAGGRYDRLIKSMGGPDVPAIGWALGVERTLQAAGGRRNPDTPREPLVVAVSVQMQGPEARLQALGTLGLLRREAARLDLTSVVCTSLGAPFKTQLKEADQIGARFDVFEGEREFPLGKVVVKDLRANSQEEVKREDVAEYIRRKLGEGRE